MTRPTFGLPDEAWPVSLAAASRARRIGTRRPGRGGCLFVAGPPDVVDGDDPMAAFEGRKGAVLCAHSAADGKKLAERRLDAPPVFDGLIAAAGRPFMCTTDGRVVCLGGAR